MNKYLENGQPSCHQEDNKVLEYTLIGSPRGWSKTTNLTQALVASWAAGNGKSEKRNHIQTLSLVKSI